ncbi:SurA N-terminal domain-containing protein [Candidatus Saccharibacteria bacterium]|nr:SurA N-terminal domain-containing protein [Candidatus Saccharibacteria bacterium]
MKVFKKKVETKTEQEKVEARREEVLATGRKFKYPLQWTRHRVVVNTILIAFVIFSLVFVGGWLALYRFGMTDNLLFRVTQVLPVSVASVDAEDVRFSDYLMLFRSSITSIERQSGNQEQSSVDNLRNDYKRSALSEAEKYTYAIKLAKELDLTVSDAEIDTEFSRHLSVGGIERSEESFLKIIDNNFGLSRSEYRRMLYLNIIKAKVSMAIDETANQIANQVESILRANDNNFSAVAEQLGSAIIYEETGGLVDSKNIDGGRASSAIRLEPGQSSGKFVSMNGDGYYFVKLINKTDTAVNFVSIKVPFTEFNQRFKTLLDEGKITEFIEIKTSE